ncbi:hypothetical protein [Microvirga pakistanensis]|uniref:hypothetical protein n=1 Tax=Microvirga pakistanensis TaxID=1682650 RepID=UPI001FCE8B49|nr:hypothetical protein [Microvirga pakistanensis]
MPLGAKLLKVTPKAVDRMLAQLGAPCQGSSPAVPTTEHGASSDDTRLRCDRASSAVHLP